MTTATRRLALSALVTATVAVTACSTPLSTAGGPAASTPSSTTTTIAGAATPAQTKAADLRANLTYLLVEHTFLLAEVTGQVAAGTATPAGTHPSLAAGPQAATTPGRGSTTTTGSGARAAVPAGATGPVTAGGPNDAASALDANTHDLADLLGQAYGGDFAASLSSLLTARDAGFVAYAAAKAATDATAAKAATDALGANATEIASLVHGANKYVPAKTIAGTGLVDELSPQTQATTAFIDAQVAKDPAAVQKVVAAADLAPHTATVLAAATAKLFPDAYPGTATGSAANLRATLTNALVQHVYLAGLALGAVARGTDPGPALAAVANNTQQLTNVFASIYGDAVGRQAGCPSSPPTSTARCFTQLWNDHLTGLGAYAKAKASSDDQAASAAVAQLDTFRTAFGQFMAQTTDAKLGADAVAAELKLHIDSLLAFVDAAAANAPDAVTRLRVAAGHMPGMASSWAEAIAEQFPSRYLP